MTNEAPKIVVLSPIHRADDIRVYKKEIVSMLKAGYRVTHYAKCVGKAEGLIIKNYILKNSGFSKSRLLRPFNYIQLLSRSIAEQGSLYYLHNPDTMFIGIALKLLGKSVIYDVHEDYSQRLYLRKYIPRKIKPMLTSTVVAVEKICSCLFDAFIATQEEIKDRLNGRAHIITNPPILPAHFLPVELKSGTLKFVYVGSISHDRGIRKMIDFVEAYNEYHPSTLTIIGDIPKDILGSVLTMSGWRYVNYTGYLQQEEAHVLAARCDVGLLLLDDAADYRQTSPNKLYEYMLLGIPYISSRFPKWVEQLGRLDGGWFVDPALSGKEIASLLENKITDRRENTLKGQRNQRFLREDFNWHLEEGSLLNIINKVVQNKTQSR